MTLLGSSISPLAKRAPLIDSTVRHDEHAATLGSLDTDTEEVSERECLELLGTEEVGRLGVVVAGRPEIYFPINYALDAAGAVIFDAGANLKLATAVNHHVIFEVDHVSEPGSTWSVLVHGIARNTAFDSVRFTGARPRFQAPEGKHCIVRILQTQISGRRPAKNADH